MNENVQLAAADGHRLDAYLNRAADAHAAVVVLQEIFGVNHHVRTMVDRFAAAGFTAIAPALFDRVQRGVELGYDANGSAQGRKIATALKPEEILQDIDAAIGFGRGEIRDGRVGVVGYCFGGGYAWLSAARLRSEAAVGYYGAMAKYVDEAPHCPVMLHYGAEDAHIPVTDADKIRTAYPAIPVYVYDGAGHGFSCDDRQSFAPDAAALAWSRTLAFLQEHLRR